MSESASKRGDWSLPATAAESRILGKEARRRLPRSSVAQWDPGRRSTSALDRLRAQEQVRDTTLLPLRHERRASSSWAYLRGAAAVMAADLGAYGAGGRGGAREGAGGGVAYRGVMSPVAAEAPRDGRRERRCRIQRCYIACGCGIASNLTLTDTE